MCGEDVQTGGVAGFAVAAAGQGDYAVVLSFLNISPMFLKEIGKWRMKTYLSETRHRCNRAQCCDDPG
jgi:hypothetical protein